MVSMHGIFTYIHHKNQPNVGIYTIHGSYGIETWGKKKLFGTPEMRRISGVIFRTTKVKAGEG